MHTPMSTEVRHVSDAITCLRRASYLTCSYIVRTAVGLVLVDAGMARKAQTCSRACAYSMPACTTSGPFF